MPGVGDKRWTGQCIVSMDSTQLCLLWFRQQQQQQACGPWQRRAMWATHCWQKCGAASVQNKWETGCRSCYLAGTRGES